MHTVVLYSVVSGEDDESASAKGAFCHPLLLCNYTMVIYHHIEFDQDVRTELTASHREVPVTRCAKGRPRFMKRPCIVYTTVFCW